VQPNREKGFTSGNVLAALIRRREAALRPSHRRTEADTSWSEPDGRIVLATHWHEGVTVAPPRS
jgi:hypothetical protein